MGSAEWKQGLCGCMDDCETCMCGSFCTPCLIYRNAEDLNKSGILCCLAKLVKSMELTEAPLEMLELQFAVLLASIARLHLKSSNTETIHKMCIVRRNSLLLRNAISFFKKSS